MKAYFSESAGFLFGLMLLVAVSGCGPKGEFSTAKVEGTVLAANGTPIESGKIKFSPMPSGDAEAKSGKPAVGRIKDGKFTLTTYGDSDGAVVGRHTVFLNDAKIGKTVFTIAPESKTVEVVTGINEIEIKAVPTRRRGEDEDDD